MKAILALLLVLCSAVPAMADVTRADIKKLLDAKVSDNVIVEYVKTNAPVRMTASDLASLKNAGATDNVLTVLAQYMSQPSNIPNTTTAVIVDYYPYGYPYWYFGPYYYGYGYYYGGRYYGGRYYGGYRPVIRPGPIVRPNVVRPNGGHGGHGGHR